jgi:shikimate kinase
MNIYLIGYRCTGKTTVGRLLARKLGWNFVDTDARIAEAEGRSIARIVQEEGWKAVRRLEASLMADLARKEDTVAATGAGVVLDPGNVDRMRDSGHTVWLQASAAEIGRRMLADPSAARLRPAPTREVLSTRIAGTLETRSPIYRAACDLAVDVGGKEPESVVKEIMGNLH